MEKFYLAKHDKPREVLKGKLVIDAYNLFSEKDIMSITSIPVRPRELLLSMPYLVLVWIVAIDKKKRFNWGRPKIRDYYNISEQEARNICSSTFYNK